MFLVCSTRRYDWRQYHCKCCMLRWNRSGKRSRMWVKCITGYVGSGSSQLVRCNGNDVEVTSDYTCNELTCDAVSFPVGTQGSSGSNGCSPSNILSPVTNNVCDMSCEVGYTLVAVSLPRYIVLWKNQIAFPHFQQTLCANNM